MNQKKYGFFTATTMITGIVIGSGIFFKSDNILQYTNGNVPLGVLVFTIAAFAIVFGSLSISQLAERTDKPGGLITYYDDFIGTGFSRAFGWFQMLLYFPTLTAVLPWVVGIYICQLFNINGTNLTFSMIGFVVMIVVYAFNILSSRFGGYFQNAAMIIKLIPLITIAVFGLIFGHPGQTFHVGFQTIRPALQTTGWIAAFAPIAFSFDGWTVSTSICHEIKNSKRNLPLALIISPFVVLCLYIIYFVGMTSYVGVDKVIELGDKSASLAANHIFGAFGGKLLLIFIVVSVLGTTNGLILGFIRIPYSLAVRNMIPRSDVFAKLNPRYGISISSAIFSFCLSVICLVIHYMTQEMQIPGDISEISIAFSYILYIALYVSVFKLMKKEHHHSFMMGYLVPTLAIIGSLIIFLGSIGSAMFPISCVICAAVLLFGFFYRSKQNI